MSVSVLFDDQVKVLAFVLPSDMGVYVWWMLAFKATIRTLVLGLPATSRTQMRVQRTFVLVTLRTSWTDVMPRLSLVHRTSDLDREGRIHEATSRDVSL